MEKRDRASSLSLQAWHQRFTQQATWTENLRAFLYQSYHLSSARRVVEIGSGTGASSSDLPAHTGAEIFCVDLRLDFLKFAQAHQPSIQHINADGFRLPFSKGSMDAALCHFLLLWVASPLQILTEMRRVTRSGGVVIALAEPDYGGRIDYPPELSRLGLLQKQALVQQGAHPEIGRELNHLFHQAGLTAVHYGLLGGEWKDSAPAVARESEWLVLEDDLKEMIEGKDLQELKQADTLAHQRGSRTLFVPTFYAAGIVP